MDTEQSPLGTFEVVHRRAADPWHVVLPAPAGAHKGPAAGSSVPAQRGANYVRVRDEEGRSLGVLRSVTSGNAEATCVVLAPTTKLEPPPATHARVTVEPASAADFAAHRRHVKRRDHLLPLTCLGLLIAAVTLQLAIDLGIVSALTSDAWFTVIQVVKYAALAVGVAGLAVSSRWSPD